MSACLPSTERQPQPPSSAKTRAAKACDACRLRRKKCEFGAIADSEDAIAGTCNRCLKLQLKCTFHQPQRNRGRKKTSSDGVVDSTSADLESHSGRIPVNPSAPLPTPLGTPSVFLHNSPNSQHDSTLPDSRFIYLHSGHTLSPPNVDALPRLSNNLCSRQLILLIIDDYLRYVYPLVPLVHRPSLINDLSHARDERDKDFQSLVVGLSGLVVSLLPRKFREYCEHRFPLRYLSPKEMLNHCHAIILSNRGPDYFDHISHMKWAIAYTMRLAFYHVGEHNRSRMMDVESMQIARLLSFHKISEYEGLSCIETQLRKKGFWLVFYSYVHNQLQSLRNERLSYIDPHLLEAIRLHDLLPIELDDEAIFENSYGMDSTREPCVTSGFIIHSRVFWAALRSTIPSSDNLIESCLCHRNKHPRDQMVHIKSRLRELRYILDGITPRLRQWAPVPNPSEELPHLTRLQTIEVHFAIMRANLHSTHIWLQSILLDQLDALLQNKDLAICPQESPVYTPVSIWAEREELSRQLLHVLFSIPFEHLEPNGLNLTEKVRDVAVSLLSCPYPPEHEASKRALEYVKSFTETLARFELDPVHTSNTQTWIDVGRLIQPNHQNDTPNTADTVWS